ncbi:MAG: N-acetylmuramoyl-L-alanine amidase [Clostridia bacterium]|nr:N-acetylmuramoyl-L-alanine amidase [Clostridia bacterium]
MKKTKILTAATIGISVIIIGIIVAMFVTGKFDSLKKNFADETTTAIQTETTTQPTLDSGRPKTAVPESVVAAVYSDKSGDELANFEKAGFNTVIFELKADNTADIAALLEGAKAKSLYFGVYADVSQGSEFLTAFTKQYNTDFIIIGGYDETLSDFEQKAGTLCDEIKAADPAMCIGIEPAFTSKASPSLISLTESGKADFVFLCHESGKESVFETARTVWNEKTSPLWLCHDLSGISSYSSDKAADTVELIKASADMSLCKGLAFTPYGEISKASGTAADIVMNYIKERDTYLLDKEFSLTSHKKTSITTEQSTITFRGTSSPAHELKCNGQVLKVSKNGDFAIDISLKAGSNTVKFEHKGKTYTYTVTYKIKLLKSVSPSDSITVPGEMQVEVFAVAHKKATVSVEFNEKTYKMTATGETNDSEGSAIDEASDFTTFSATLDTPASTSSVQKLGKYKVTAKYSSLTESLSGAAINVSAKVAATPPPVTQPVTTTETTTEPTTQPVTVTDAPSDGATDTSGQAPTEEQPSSTQTETSSFQGTLQKYNYTENYGLGAARICEIIDDYVETYPGNNTKTFSVPDCSPLLKGTVDYVTAEVICDDETYYVLSSGVKVPKLREERLASGSDGKVTHVSIKDGYVMPKNTINVLSCSSSSGDTVIVLEMNRNVAFNAKLTGQTYSIYNGNASRPVVVSSLNCTGLEFTFSDTLEAHGDLSLNGSVCKAGKWSSDSGKSTVTLSFTLAEKGKFYGFHYEYNRDGNLVITINHKPASLSGYTIMLDPGHGGIDPGAPCSVSATGFSQEKEINLSIATKVKELLEAEGANVIMTRSTDKWVCYTDRNSAVRDRNPDMFISIHCDSSTSASAMGTSAYYYRAYSQPLAKAVHNSIVEAYKTKIYADKTELHSSVSRGSNFYAFRVARVEECPAILIEYGFVSNQDECAVLQTAANRDILAQATVQGIKNYVAAS